MKVVLSLAAVLALAVGLNLTTADDANVCHLLLHNLEINPLRHCVLLLFGEMILDYDL